MTMKRPPTAGPEEGGNWRPPALPFPARVSSLEKLADLLHASRATARGWASRFPVQRDAEGWPVEEFMHALREAERQRLAAQEEFREGGGGGDGDTARWRKAKADKMEADAAKAKLDLEERQAQLFQRSSVEEAINEMAQIYSEMLSQILERIDDAALRERCAEVFEKAVEDANRAAASVYIKTAGDG